MGGREKAKLMIQILIRPSYFGLGSVHTRQTVFAFMVKMPSCCAGLIGETALFLVSTAGCRGSVWTHLSKFTPFSNDIMSSQSDRKVLDLAIVTDGIDRSA